MVLDFLLEFDHWSNEKNSGATRVNCSSTYSTGERKCSIL